MAFTAVRLKAESFWCWQCDFGPHQYLFGHKSVWNQHQCGSSQSHVHVQHWCMECLGSYTVPGTVLKSASVWSSHAVTALMHGMSWQLYCTWYCVEISISVAVVRVTTLMHGMSWQLYCTWYCVEISISVAVVRVTAGNKVVNLILGVAVSGFHAAPSDSHVITLHRVLAGASLQYKRRGWSAFFFFSICLSFCLSFCLPVCLFICLSICLFICLSLSLNMLFCVEILMDTISLTHSCLYICKWCL